ncbi:MAG TPA: urea carboxylase [Steroidobacteraceae bacterium]|jgi:urea carboxylase|nr:urea carboxylase [Steroidobacteraceae bacterium]
MFNKVLIANRGAIACRIIRTLRRLGIDSVAVYSDADLGSLHVREADAAVRIGPAPAAQSYLHMDAIIAAARSTGATAIHPGYGFLSENAQFAERCAQAGLTFIGPTPENIRAFGLKHTARQIAQQAGLPLMAGSDLLGDEHTAVHAAERVGYPVMLKATAGGGGIGMRTCENAATVREAFASIERLAGSNFANGGVYLERFVPRARHIEVQIFGDGAGRVVALGERDCSLQRRNQKLMEEAPAPHLPAATRASLRDAALRLGRAAHYLSAGTVEFLYDPERDQFFFLEVNTRLQVEHGVTEQVTGVDLVEWMVRGAAGELDFLDTWKDASVGASIQARIYAEDPDQDFRPCSGVLSQVKFAPNVRVETWVTDGSEVSACYDPLLAKLIVTARDRDSAVRAMQTALDHTALQGLETNLEWLRQAARSEAFVSGQLFTAMAQSIQFQPQTIRVQSGGLATTVQDHPGRRGYWDVGVPPSGPMDALSFRIGNQLLGNPPDAAGLEITLHGPVLLFRRDTRICVTGAALEASVDGAAIDAFRPVRIRAGQTLKLGRIRGAGMRAYLLLAGGIDVPVYLGSRSTFTLGRFGGHAGRTLVAGDVLRLCEPRPVATTANALAISPPRLTHAWVLRVLYGPHGAPDFFAPEDIDMLSSVPWKVHYNSSRTGVRLIGPRPRWARRDGGEAGLHPSNIHDNAYAIGTIDFTGDMPIILGPDGPSLGGFVCPLVVIQADLWKVGQLAPGDSLSFEIVSDTQARAAEDSMEALFGDPPPPLPSSAARGKPQHSPVLDTIAARSQRPQVVYRRQGDRHILVEYGPLMLDLTLRIRIHALMLELQRRALPGVIDITPGVRSLQVHFDSRVLTQDALLAALADAEDRIGDLTEFSIPSRVIHLPLSWGDPAIYATIEKYMASVRSDAPWCPDNIEFIRRINGLPSINAVRDIVFDARYLVMGLGDVYLGAPVATPLDPRHRLVTTKYNPARTWTPPNVVGIGGAYLCIYGMEGPGGYQLFGRTVQMWNTWQQTKAFTEDKPWLLRFFDQIRFFPVSHAELTEWRRDFPLGRRDVRIESATFSLAAYRLFLAANAPAIETFQTQRQAAFEAEREAWVRDKEFSRVEKLLQEPADVAAITSVIPAGSEVLEAPLGGNVWKVNVRPGDRVARGTVIAVIEAMKMECDVPAPQAGIVRAVYVQPRQAINPGAAIIALETQGHEV